MDLHQVHTDRSPERLSIHINVAVASLRHLKCILGLCVNGVCALGTKFVKYAVSMFFPVEVFNDVELVVFIIVLGVGVE